MGTTSGAERGAGTLRKRSLAFGLMAAIALAIYLCTAHPGSDSVESFLESGKVSRPTPWVAMHMLLVLPEEHPMPGEEAGLTIGETLRTQGLRGLPALLSSSGEEARKGPARTVRGHFECELEDHYAQYQAYRALGPTSASAEDPAAYWLATLSDFEKLCEARPSASKEELSWLIMLGATASARVGSPRADAMIAELDELCRESYVAGDHSTTRACGGMHAAVAAALVMRLPGLSRDSAETLREAVDYARLLVEATCDGDGYVSIPGLHNALIANGPDEEVRVLGHVVEFLSLVEPPLTPSEATVVDRFERALDLCSWTGRATGDACHGLAGLSRLARAREAQH